MTFRVRAPYPLGWPIWASLGAHGVALVAASSVLTWQPSTPEPAPVPIEVVRLETAAAPPAEPPKVPKAAKAVQRAPIIPPRPVAEPTPSVIDQTPATPLPADDAPRRESAVPAAEPVEAGRRFLAGASSSSGFAMPGPSESSATGAGKLFSTGDLPIPGRPGGSGKGSGGGGEGTGTEGPPQVASITNPTGLTSFARPAGGPC